MARHRLHPQGNHPNNIIALMVRENLTQGELARRAGMGPSAVSRLVNWDRPLTRKTIDRLKVGLNCSADELLIDPRRAADPRPMQEFIEASKNDMASRMGWDAAHIQIIYNGGTSPLVM